MQGYCTEHNISLGIQHSKTRRRKREGMVWVVFARERCVRSVRRAFRAAPFEADFKGGAAGPLRKNAVRLGAPHSAQAGGRISGEG